MSIPQISLPFAHMVVSRTATAALLFHQSEHAALNLVLPKIAAWRSPGRSPFAQVIVARAAAVALVVFLAIDAVMHLAAAICKIPYAVRYLFRGPFCLEIKAHRDRAFKSAWSILKLDPIRIFFNPDLAIPIYTANGLYRPPSSAVGKTKISPIIYGILVTGIGVGICVAGYQLYRYFSPPPIHPLLRWVGLSSFQEAGKIGVLSIAGTAIAVALAVRCVKATSSLFSSFKNCIAGRCKAPRGFGANTETIAKGIAIASVIGSLVLPSHKVPMEAVSAGLLLGTGTIPEADYLVRRGIWSLGRIFWNAKPDRACMDKEEWAKELEFEALGRETDAQGHPRVVPQEELRRKKALQDAREARGSKAKKAAACTTLAMLAWAGHDLFIGGTLAIAVAFLTQHLLQKEQGKFNPLNGKIRTQTPSVDDVPDDEDDEDEALSQGPLALAQANGGAKGSNTVSTLPGKGGQLSPKVSSKGGGEEDGTA